MKGVRAGYRAQPLSACPKTPPPPAPPAIDFPKIDRELVKTELFEQVDFALPLAPERPEQKESRAKPARIGVGPAKTLSLRDLSLEHGAEILLVRKAGSKKADEKLAARGAEVNGWRIPLGVRRRGRSPTASRSTGAGTPTPGLSRRGRSRPRRRSGP